MAQRSYIFMFLAVMQSSTANASMTIKDAVLFGIAHSPRMQASQAALENARLEWENTRARFLPRLDSDAHAVARLTTSPEFGKNGPLYDKTAGLTLSQILWDGGVLSYTSSAAKSRVEASEFYFIQNRDQLILDVVKAFYDLSEALLATESHEDHKKNLEKQAQDISEAFHRGMRVKRDVMSVQTELQRQELVVIGVHDEAERAKEHLLTLIGANNQDKGPENEIQFERLLPNSSETLRHALLGDQLRLEMSNTVLVKRQKSEERTEGFLLESERRRKLWPSIDLSLDSKYRWNESGSAQRPRAFSRDGVNWSASIGLQYTLWDWGIRNREIATVVNDQKKASAERSLVYAELQQKIVDVRRVLGQAEKNMKLNDALLKLAKEANTATTDDFKRGRASYLEVVDTIQKVREAKLASAKAYFNWLRNAWEFRYYAGGVYDVVQKL